MKTATIVLIAKNILEGDYQKVREDFKKDTPVTTTDKQTRHLVGGASLYIDRILAAYDERDVDEDLYWALIYLFMVIDERKYNLNIEAFEESTHCVSNLAKKYRPEILRKTE